jgi:chromosomal replication initiation ATPase DnaA
MPAQLLPEQLPLPLPGHRVALGVEDFLVAPSNRAVIGWIDRWPDWPFAALVVVGPRGSGKSHAAALWQSRSGARTVDLATLDLEAATDLVSRGEPILIDDADRMLAQGGPAELTLLRLYNLARAAGAAIMMTAEAPPASWVVGLADTRSRLNSAMVVEMGSPDDTLLAAVAAKLFNDRQLSPSEGVIPYLLSHGERSFAAVAEAVAALDRAALKDRREISTVLAREVLAGLAERGGPLA